MAEFLTTVGTSYHIENIIKSANEFLILVSPYLKINDVLLERLIDTDSKGVNITIIYGKESLLESEKEKLNKLNNLNILFANNLHAKCYCNEQNAIISSMNLYEYSERNNREMSILINKMSEEVIYNQIIEEIESIKNNSIVEQQNINDFNEKELSRKDEITLFVSKYYHSFYDKYLNHDISKNSEEFRAFKFPFEGIELTVTYILIFEFKNIPIVKHLSDNFWNELRSRLGNYRCYWNEYKYNIKIYPAKDYDMGFQGRELNSRVQYFMKATEITEKFLRECKEIFI
ncbi:MAG: phospholipase D-like domain-containing protein [bacterium]